MAPQFGRTQYFFGAVVLILNKTFFSVGFLRLICDVTGCVNGPGSDKIVKFSTDKIFVVLKIDFVHVKCI